MFDESQKIQLKPETATAQRTGRFVFKGLPVSDLITYHDEIRKLLPPLTLKEMDLEGELLLQYHALRSVQNQVLEDDEVPVNQRAQLANAVGTTLNRMAELQTHLYTSERFKRVENMLVRALKDMPEEAVTEFFEGYQRLLDTIR